MSDLESIKIQFTNKIKEVDSLQSCEALRLEFLGKKGLVSELLGKINQVGPDERKAYGESVNNLKNFIILSLDTLKKELEEKMMDLQLETEKIDITLAPRNFIAGKEHPISKAIFDMKDILSRLGFDFVAGPDIESDWNNFTALNIPEHHPARQMHDTFYLEGEEKNLLRTHTSTVQIRHMLANKPPIKIISIGKVYRSEMDATHTPMFHQLEGLFINEKVTMSDLKSYLETFLKMFFGVENLKIRLRPSYFPFTEPSVEVDVLCDRSGSEIKIGVGNDWLEVLGAGMVHNKVLENVGIDHNQYQGFAFGCGVERLVMLKYNIPDLRTFYEGDIRWINHFGMV